MSSGSEPVQTIRATERLGFFETAQAMKEIIGTFGADVSTALDMPFRDGKSEETDPMSRSRFSQFRSKCNPFE